MHDLEHKDRKQRFDIDLPEALEGVAGDAQDDQEGNGDGESAWQGPATVPVKDILERPRGAAKPPSAPP